MILIILLFLQFHINILRFTPILDGDIKTARTSPPQKASPLVKVAHQHLHGEKLYNLNPMNFHLS